MGILVIDVGTSSVRAAIVDADASVDHVHRRPLPPETPAPGLVQFDPQAMAEAALGVAAETLDAAGGSVDAVGVTTQRSSAIAWDPGTGDPIGPGLGWQDLRTVGTCLELQAYGFNFSPSEAATKFAWLLEQAGERKRAGVKLGTVDSWIAWHLTGRGEHLTDPSNAAVTGLYSIADRGWRPDALDRLGIDVESLPRVVDSSGNLSTASALPGSPPLCAVVGDQQASLMGQGCTRPGLAKATFGTGGMLEVCLGPRPPEAVTRGSAGCFPIVAWQIGGDMTWGVEAIMLAAGTAVDWLVDDLGLISTAAESEALAASCDDTDGVVAVPALLGLATPQWDFGARGAIFGLTRGSNRAHLARAVLEGVAHSGADLLESAEAETGLHVSALRVDGGMSANSVFVQALADACERPIEVSPQLEATTLGAGYLAGLAVGTWSGTADVAASWAPKRVVEPSGRPNQRDRWKRAVERAAQWYPDLSAIKF